MRLFKVFLSAVFLFVFFNAHAQPITGAFGLKLGEYVPDWPEGDVGKAEITDFKDDFFDRVEFRVLPYSKRIYYIEGIKIVQTMCGSELIRNALISSLREKYSEHEIETHPDNRAIWKFEAKDGDRSISLMCAAKREDWLLALMYTDMALYDQLDKERLLLENRKIDGSKL